MSGYNNYDYDNIKYPILRQYRDARCAQCGRLIVPTLHACDRCKALTSRTECARLIAELRHLRHQVVHNVVQVCRWLNYENGEAYRL